MRARYLLYTVWIWLVLVAIAQAEPFRVLDVLLNRSIVFHVGRLSPQFHYPVSSVTVQFLDRHNRVVADFTDRWVQFYWEGSDRLTVITFDTGRPEVVLRARLVWRGQRSSLWRAYYFWSRDLIQGYEEDFVQLTREGRLFVGLRDVQCFTDYRFMVKEPISAVPEAPTMLLVASGLVILACILKGLRRGKYDST